MPAESDSQASVPPLLGREGGLFVCPLCRAPLAVGSGRIRCSGCGEAFGCEEGIPDLFRSPAEDQDSAVTERVRAFYEETPFPDYEELDSAASLRDKARQGLFARLLDDQIPDRAWVLDVGCGTGQLANFLALQPGRTVVGADASLSSLRLAQEFKVANRIDNATFVRMNLFRPVLRPGSFHLVIANGVLHHTSDPRGGFQILSRLVRDGGFFIVGLYNRLGRLPTDLRRVVFRLTGDRGRFLDPRLRATGLGDRRQHSWFMDQYRHPHESKHTIGEVLGWLDRCGLEFVSAVPKLRALAPFGEAERLFVPAPRGSVLDQWLVQLVMLFGGGREGGLFVIIGRKEAS